MLASLASVSISVTDVLAVETSERVVHRALMTRVPEALEATLHPDATRAVAEFFLHSMVGTREAGRVMPQCVMPFAGASPPITGVAHRMEALPCVANTLRVEVRGQGTAAQNDSRGTTRSRRE